MGNQLRLVTDAQGATPGDALGAARGPAQRLFAHWVYMMGKSARRTVLGPSRERALLQALRWGYDEATLRLAIEGCAATPHNMGRNDRGEEYNDLTLILRDEAHVERFAATGERVRRELAAEQAAARDGRGADEAAAVSDADAAAQREALRAFARARVGRG